MMGNGYPKRPSHFANRYTRLLTKTCAVQEIGHVAFTLCVVIAHLEDSKRYTGPVTFYNDQLLALLGVRKWDTLAAARTRAIKAGWLHYEPGRRLTFDPGKYWVTLPEVCDGIDDTGCDESGKRYTHETDIAPQALYPRNGDKSGDKSGDKWGEHSIPIPKPIPKPKNVRSAQKEPEGFAEFYAAYPRKVGRPKAAEQYAKALASGATVEVLLASAVEFAASDIGRGEQQYIPHPSTWLHSGRWQDDRAGWSRKPKGSQNGTTTDSRGARVRSADYNATDRYFRPAPDAPHAEAQRGLLPDAAGDSA